MRHDEQDDARRGQEAWRPEMERGTIRFHDHEGTGFLRSGNAAWAWHLDSQLVRKRLREHGDVELALTVPVDLAKSHGREVVSPHGDACPSIRAMCTLYHTDANSFERYVNHKHQEPVIALGGPKRADARPVPRFTDHQGNEYLTPTSMARAWGHSWKTVRRRLDHGWSLQRALETPLRRYKRSDGGRTLSERAREHGVDPETARDRMARGWSEEDALGTPPFERRRQGGDGTGREPGAGHALPPA